NEREPVDPTANECNEASKLVYTVETNGSFARFDPSTMTFTDLGKLACPTDSWAFSMTIDRYAMAWVLYADGTLYHVDIQNGLFCTKTDFVATSSIIQFSMGYSTDTPGAGDDTLYFAGNTVGSAPSALFGSLDTSSFALATEGTVVGFPDLTGNG